MDIFTPNQPMHSLALLKQYIRHSKLSSITQIFKLPVYCRLCSERHFIPGALCASCKAQLKVLGPHCEVCAIALPPSQTMRCGHCIKKPPYFDQVITAYAYQEPLRSLLHEFKYQSGLYLIPCISQLMLDAWVESNTQTQCLIPVPMHFKRLRERGFNQAAVLAQYLGKTLKLPYDLQYCEKIIHTSPQAVLNRSKRQQNLRGVFAIRKPPMSHVTLVDDLVTTGSTVNEMARILKLAGVERVDVWCCGRV